MRERSNKSVIGRTVQSTLREMRKDYSSPRTYVLLIAAIFLIGLSGPFGTFASLGFVERYLYWAVMITSTFAVGNLVGTWVQQLLGEKGWRPTMRFVPIGVAAGIAVSFVVASVDAVVFGWSGLSTERLLQLLGYSLPVAVVISAAIVLMHDTAAVSGSGDSVDDARENGVPRLVERLPFDKRGRIISMSVADHYVEVTTVRGKAMLLMRLRDAIAEVDGNKGLQIHRSHWVALDGIRAVHRGSGRVEIETEVAERLPVSRSYLADVRSAGLLP